MPNLPPNKSEEWRKRLLPNDKGLHKDYELYVEDGDYFLLSDSNGHRCLHRKSDGATWSAPGRAIAHLMSELSLSRQNTLKEVEEIIQIVKDEHVEFNGKRALLSKQSLLNKMREKLTAMKKGEKC